MSGMTKTLYNVRMVGIDLRTYSSDSQRTIQSSTSGAMVSSISRYSEEEPVAQCWKR